MNKIFAGGATCLALAILVMAPSHNRAARPSVSTELPPPSSGTFTIIDAPGAGTSALQGTAALSISPLGGVAGSYIAANESNVSHGFVRSPNGSLIGFDAPGAGTSKNQGTFVMSGNTSGEVTGVYSDSTSVYHGFVSNPAKGTFASFDAPDANTNLDAGTVPMSINTAGEVTGMYRDVNLVYHGFVRDPSTGAITEFDAPGAGTGYIQGTQPLNINAAGWVVGYFRDTNYVDHGFVRAPNGNITTLDAPGAGSNPGQTKGIQFQGTVAASINASEVVTGSYADSSFANHGFVYVLSTNTYTEFDVPGAGGPGTFGTVSGSINSSGMIAGAYQDVNGVFHGFLRAPGNTFSTLDAPGSGGTAMLNGTGALSMNDAGQIAGVFSDANNVYHAFLYNPPTVPAATLSPASLSFGNQALNISSLAKKVTLTSSGTANLTSISVSVTGANMSDFTQTSNCPTTLAPTKKCTISVVFKPSQLGARKATLSVSDSAANSPQTVPLTGTGIAQGVATPPTLIFASQTVGTKSAAKTVTLTNNLPTALTINSIKFTGANPGDFAETDTCDGSVPAKSKCTISVTFTPTATGTRTATLTISDSASNTPQTVALKGTGK